MGAGHPLTDADRLPWLRSIAAWITDRLATGRPGVVTCSALKRKYRDLLAGGNPDVAMALLAPITGTPQETVAHIIKSLNLTPADRMG